MNDVSDAVSVFNAIVAAVHRGAWDEAAALCDPGSLAAFKRELLERLDVKPEPFTVEKMLTLQPDLPREVAEFQVAQFNATSGPEQLLRSEVPRVVSAAELRQMTPVEVFAAWLEGRSPEREIERLRRETDIPPSILEQVLRNWPERSFCVLGTVPEGERFVHIVYRQEHAGPDDDGTSDGHAAVASDSNLDDASSEAELPAPGLEIATLRRQPDGSWRIIADQGFLGLEQTSFSIGFADEGASPT